MASLKTALRRKNANGGYDTILLQGDSTITYRPSGRTVEQDLAAYLPSVQNSDVVPESLPFGRLQTGQHRVWVGNSTETPVEIITKNNVPATAAGQFLATDENGDLVAVDGAAMSTKTINMVLLAANWADNAQTLIVEGIDKDTNGVLELASTITDEQKTAATEANIAFSQGDGVINFTCDSAPTVDIPLTLHLTNVLVNSDVGDMRANVYDPQGKATDIFKYIDENSVPSDWNQNDANANNYVKNRTHYTTDPVETVLVEETSLEFSDTFMQNPFVLSEIVEGQTYKVVWDGTIYECVGYIINDINDIPSIGNGSIFGVDGGANEPFFISAANGNVMVCVSGTGTHTVSIETKQCNIVKLPLEYHQNSNIINGEGYGSVKTIGATEASGMHSHAEGYKTTASGDEGSHAEGNRTIASGMYSHAEGFYTEASGEASHAEGYETTASGMYSHAEGCYTIASSYCQHVQGEYNIEDSTKTYAHIVGNGTDSNTRSNAHTVDWDGNAWFQGDVYVGSNSGTNKDDGSVKLQRAITGTAGDFVVIGSDGNVTTKTVPNAEEASF